MANNNYANEFLTEVIPHFAADQEWTNLFADLATTNEDEKARMFQRLNTMPEINEDLSIAKKFISLCLTEPAMSRMMIKAINYVSRQEVTA